MTKSVRKRSGPYLHSSIVADGYERLYRAVEAEVRPWVEQAYTETWNRSGILKRLSLQRKMEQEIATLVAQRCDHISAESLF